MREFMNVRYRTQRAVSLGHLGGLVYPTPTMSPTLVMCGQYRFSQSFSLVTTKACWEMQLLWESVESPGHNSSVSDVEEDSFSGSNVLTTETINTWDCCACWLGHREFLSAVSVISLRGKQPSSYIWIWDSTMSTKTYCAPCNLWAKEFRRGQRDVGVGEEVDSMVGGSEEASGGRGPFCFLISRLQSPCWHLIFAVINIFGVRHTKCKVTYC